MKALLSAVLALLLVFAPARADCEPLQPVARLRSGLLDAGIGRPMESIQLVFPAALAARRGEVYVADVGLGWVLRYEQASGRFAKLLPAHPGTRLALGADQSLYVLDPSCQCIRRYSRSGQLMQEFADRLNLPAPVDFTLDEARGTLWALDGSHAQMVGFNPFGRVIGVLSLASTGVVPVALLRGPNGFFVLDRVGRRVVALDEQGRLVRFLGEGQVADPAALALDRHGRLLVADRSGQTIKRLWPEPVEELPSGLRFMLLGGLAVDESHLLVSDQQAGYVEVLHYPPPQAR